MKYLGLYTCDVYEYGPYIQAFSFANTRWTKNYLQALNRRAIDGPCAVDLISFCAVHIVCRITAWVNYAVII